MKGRTFWTSADCLQGKGPGLSETVMCTNTDSSLPSFSPSSSSSSSPCFPFFTSSPSSFLSPPLYLFPLLLCLFFCIIKRENITFLAINVSSFLALIIYFYEQSNQPLTKICKPAPSSLLVLPPKGEIPLLQRDVTKRSAYPSSVARSLLLCLAASLVFRAANTRTFNFHRISWTEQQYE